MKRSKTVGKVLELPVMSRIQPVQPFPRVLLRLSFRSMGRVSPTTDVLQDGPHTHN